jgi:tRNA (guanine-N7-)-methyltransferase
MEPPRRQIWGRRQGPRLRAGRQHMLDHVLPQLTFPLPHEAQTLDPASLFPAGMSEVWLEIGFGGGEHLAEQARLNPGVAILGVEPFLNGVASLLSLLAANRAGNVRVLVDDARLLLRSLRTDSIARAFVLFPDPWPKLRHHKRRIINPDTVRQLARVLKPRAELRLATDDTDYSRAMLEALLRNGRFEWLAQSAADWQTRPSDWPSTRYEQKAIAAARRPAYLKFTRCG